jgi:hypothetical protein
MFTSPIFTLTLILLIDPHTLALLCSLYVPQFGLCLLNMTFEIAEYCQSWLNFRFQLSSPLLLNMVHVQCNLLYGQGTECVWSLCTGSPYVEVH